MSESARGAPAVLVLEDGTVFHGTGFGASGEVFGEMVFNTGMTGYQETLTDPSYHRQIVAMTAPHIGNTGVNEEDAESRRIWVAGFVVREPARLASSWRSTASLDDELADQGVVAIATPATRALTRHLRSAGAMRAGLSNIGTEPGLLLERVLDSPSMIGADLAREVSVDRPYVMAPPDGVPVRFRVAAIDLGIKKMTPRALAQRGCEVHVLPATSSTEDILAIGPDGVFLSNGPGDPAACEYAVEATRGVLAAGIPFFGICLGNQILGRALGLGTYKLTFGHRGVNQPVALRSGGRVHITSHNHGFAVDAGRSGAGPEPFDTPFGRAEVSHIALNDNVVEGLRLLDTPAYAVQYHPEAAPGPHDARGEFDRFCEMMNGGAHAKA